MATAIAPTNKCLLGPPTTADERLSSVPSLRPLQPVEMQPQWRPNALCFAGTLQRIERIHVARSAHESRGALPRYVTSVFFQERQSRIPTVAHKRPLAHCMQSTDREADLQVEHTFSQFSALRDAAHASVQSSHPGSPCEFCAQLCGYMGFGRGRSMAFVQMGFDTVNDASSSLTDFLNTLLEECKRLIDLEQRGGCRAQSHVPFLLYTFLHQS